MERSREEIGMSAPILAVVGYAFTALDLVLRILLRGVSAVALIIEVSDMYSHDAAGDVARLRVPPDVITDCKSKQLPLSSQSTEQFVRVTKCSSAAVASTEFPNRSSSGDQTQIVPTLGMTATVPPPTPLFAGKPTR
jgi:hypothetical protein